MCKQIAAPTPNRRCCLSVGNNTTSGKTVDSFEYGTYVPYGGQPLLLTILQRSVAELLILDKSPY